MLADKAAQGGSQEVEMCCVVKLVNGQWRVSGVVVDPPDGGPPVTLDFERPQQPPKNVSPSQDFVRQPPAIGVETTVRTAKEPAAGSPR
jgi:hypothetical protein